MSPDRRQARKKEYIVKTMVTSVFLGAFALFTGWMLFYGPGFNALQLTTLDIVLLGFATYRMGHLISYDRVMEPLRSFFTETIPDPTGEGETVEPKGEGLQQVIGQLLCCPVCTSTWAAAAMVYALYLAPGPARVFITILGIVGIGEILNAAGELFSWGGQYARNASGSINLARKQREQILTPQNYTDSLDEDEDSDYKLREKVYADRVKNPK